MKTENTAILNKTYQKLILQVSQTEVSFSIFDSLRNRIEQLQSVSFGKILTPNEIELKLIDIFENSSYFSKKFDDVLVLHNNNLLTFAPQVLFDEAYMSSYLQYNTKVFESDFFTNDVISNYEINTVYIPYVNINNFLIDRFGGFNYKHSFTYLVKKALDFSKNIDETEMYIHVQDYNFQIIVAKNQQLVLFNSFEYKTDEDFIYYLLFTAEQLNLNPETVKLKLFGNINKESNLYEIAYKYIRNVSLFLDHNVLENGISQQDYLKHFILIHACE